MTQRRRLIFIPILLAAAFAAWWAFDARETPEERSQRIRLAEREARIEVFARETPPRNAIVFLGSSTIEFWPLATSFPGARTVNRGIGAEPVHELAERLARSLPPEPAGAVLYAGSVDFNTLGRPVTDVVRGVEALIADLRRLHKDLPIALIGINPARDTSPGRVKELKILNVNLEAACLASTPRITFVATDRAPFRNAKGQLAPAISRDRWHLNADGYARLAEWLKSAAPHLGL